MTLGFKMKVLQTPNNLNCQIIGVTRADLLLWHGISRKVKNIFVGNSFFHTCIQNASFRTVIFEFVSAQWKRIRKILYGGLFVLKILVKESVLSILSPEIVFFVFPVFSSFAQW